MKNLINNRVNDSLFFIFIAISFLYGILSYQHYSPSSHDFYINGVVFLLCSIGLFFFFLNKKVDIYLNNLMWFFLGLIFIFQPVINDIIYIDGLIFPIAISILSLMLSIAVSNIENRELLIRKLSIIIFIVALLLFVTQVSHVLMIMPVIEVMKIPLQTERFSGNLFQPNQTAFVLVLGVVSTSYFFNGLSEFKILKYLIIFTLSLGVALTLSRSGLIMLLLGVFIFNIFSNFYTKKNFYNLKDSVVSAFGFIIGIFIYKKFSSSSLDVIDRFSESGDDPRLSQLYQTWLIIKDYPITGIGWKNYAYGGLEYFEQIKWFNLADHSHFIFGHLLSEFGILGLGLIIFFLYIFMKNLLKISSIKEIYLFTVLFVFVLYSCFEYPLWYLRYLLVFSIFFALFDQSRKVYYEVEKGYLISIFSLVLIGFSIYYIIKYQELIYVSDVVFNEKNSPSEKTAKLAEVRPVFGFGYFNDLLLYQTMDTDGFLLKDQIIIGERLVNYIPMNQYLVKQGTLLALDGQEDKAIYYFKASCHYDWGRECEATKKYLHEWFTKYPNYFTRINDEINKTYGTISPHIQSTRHE